MIYTFTCECGTQRDVERSIKVGPPSHLVCECGERMEREWNPPQLLLRDDPDEVGVENLMVDTGTMSSGQAVVGGGITKAQAVKKERRYQRYINNRRKLFREEKQVGGKLTHQVPAELYHAKIRQTGDKNYWSDPDNLNRHKSCKVS